MRKVLAEKEYEINYLKKKLEQEQIMSLGDGTLTGDVAASKIVDLAKKVRELNAQIETERTKNKQLTKNYNDMESKLEHMRETRGNRQTNEDLDENEEDGENFGEKRVNLQKENKELKDKLNQTSHKMMEFKSQCEILKQDLKKAQKVKNKILFQ